VREQAVRPADLSLHLLPGRLFVFAAWWLTLF
jgi:hypothetical protein